MLKMESNELFAVLLHRKLFNDPLWREPRVYSRAEAWIDLIQLANGQGEVVESLRKLAMRWGWSKDRASRFLIWLVGEQRLVLSPSATRGRLLITKYALYQKPIIEAGAVEEESDEEAQAELVPAEASTRKTKGGRDRAILRAVRKVWRAYIDQRAEILTANGKRITPVNTSRQRLEILARLLRDYDLPTMLAAVRGLRLSDYHRGVGRFSAQGPRLSPEQVFVVNSKINQVELLAALDARGEIVATTRASTKAAPKVLPDGHLLPSGSLWSTRLDRAVVPEDFTPDPKYSGEYPLPDGAAIPGGWRWSAEHRRPERCAA